MMGHRLGKEVSGSRESHSNIPIAKQITLPYPSVVSSSLSKDTYDEVYESRFRRCSCVGNAKATDNGDIAVLMVLIILNSITLFIHKSIVKLLLPSQAMAIHVSCICQCINTYTCTHTYIHIIHVGFHHCFRCVGCGGCDGIHVITN